MCLLAADYPAVVGAVDALVADLTPGEQHDIWDGTARRVYAIG